MSWQFHFSRDLRAELGVDRSLRRACRSGHPHGYLQREWYQAQPIRPRDVVRSSCPKADCKVRAGEIFRDVQRTATHLFQTFHVGIQEGGVVDEAQKA